MRVEYILCWGNGNFLFGMFEWADVVSWLIVLRDDIVLCWELSELGDLFSMCERLYQCSRRNELHCMSCGYDKQRRFGFYDMSPM